MRRAAFMATVLLFAGLAQADETDRARELFLKGSTLAQDSQWAAALAAFEQSAVLRPHPWTTYNMAVCERALGQYVRAKGTFAKALAERTPDADLPEATARDVARFEQEIDGLLAVVDVTLDPADAAIAVDGAPLVVDANAREVTLVAGVAPAGKPAAPPSRAFHLVLDPGTHVILVSRTGFTDAVVNETVRPAEHKALTIAVSQLPASLHVASTEANAAVKLDRVDVGVAPLVLTRPAGRYHVVVEKAGFDAFETDATLAAGQSADLTAPLHRHKTSVLGRWWFWSLATVVVAGAVVTTWALTRPSPERPAVDQGGLGWAAKIP